MTYLVYILYSEELNRFYVGHTGEPINERIRKHLSAHSGYTSKAKDWILSYTEEYASKVEAYDREREIKGKKSRKSKLNWIRWIGHPDFLLGLSKFLETKTINITSHTYWGIECFY